MMLITKDLFLGVVFWPTKGAALTGAPSGTAAVACRKRWVGPSCWDNFFGGRVSMPWKPWHALRREFVWPSTIHVSFGDDTLRYFAARLDSSAPAGIWGCRPAVPRILEIASKSKTPRHIVPQATWRRTIHFFFSSSAAALASSPAPKVVRWRPALP